MQLSLAEVANILGTWCSSGERIAQGYSIDTRTLSPGQLFFAIRGPRFDGHQFVEQAMERGAVGAVVESSFFEDAHPTLASALVPVPDTSRALQDLAKSVRQKWARPVVAVTGSTGKTTIKELIAALLGKRFAVHKSAGNLNNQYGLPLTLLALEPTHEVAVVELAMSAPEEIARLAQIAEPEVGVVINVAPVHLQFFDSLDSIAKAKRELIENLKTPATAILNYDDVRVRRFSECFAGRVFTFGFKKGADFRAVDWRFDEEGGSRFAIVGPRFAGEFRLKLPGRHNVQNALAAAAAASLFDIPKAGLEEAMGRFQFLPQRSEIVTLPGGITLINDSYNSNPLAMECMLETLADWPGARRRFVVAGEMLELGLSSPDLHRTIGRKCVERGVDWLLAVQGDARYFVEGAREAGLPADRLLFFADAREAAEACRGLVQSGDVVLVKGSRGVHLEAVVELLQPSLANHSTGSGQAPARTS